MKNNISFTILAVTVMAGLVLSLVDAGAGTGAKPAAAQSEAISSVQR